MTTVLITGASGFVGGHVAHHLLNNTDYNLVLLHHISDPDGPQKPLDPSPGPRVSWVSCDLRSPERTLVLAEAAQGAFGSVRYMINLASDAQTATSVQRPVQCWADNCAIISGALELGRLLYQTGLCYFVHLSSNEVYAPSRTDFRTPGSPICPGTPYAAGKAAQEALCHAYAISYQLPVIVVNTQHLFGEKQPSGRLVPQTVLRLCASEYVDVYTTEQGDTPRLRPLHCADLAEALRLLLNTPAQEPVVNRGVQRYHIVNPCCIRAEQLVEEIAAILGRTPTIRYRYLPPERPGYVMSSTLAPALYGLDWEPLPLRTRLQQVVAHLVH
jgi:dTDP-glucose 4,6-dehydratase